jgi:hypothetical protein
MFSVLFEVLPDKENWDDYLNNAKMLRPELEQIDGFVDNIRYKSPLLLSHRDSHVLRSHIGRAPVEITTEFGNAILRKTRRRESRHEDDCERLTFDVVVSGQLPPPAHPPARVYNGQRLRLRPSLARSTISQSRDTKCKVDQGRKIAKNGAALFCEGNQATAPVSSGFGGERWHGPFGRIGSKARCHVWPNRVKEAHCAAGQRSNHRRPTATWRE